MGKKKNDRIKLPKRIAGVKIPKQARKSVNTLLKGVPAPAARPLLGAAIAALVTTLAEKLENPLRELIESHTAKPGERDDKAPRTAH